jgi:DNA-binding MarR family transcriptional regulator
MGLFFSRRDALFAELTTLHLTPPHGHALMALLAGPTRMSALADNMACDASYITAVADRLEELGFAERRAAPDDRRARELVLTDRGEQVALTLHGVVASPPDQLRALSAADQATLGRIARRLGEPVQADWLPPRTLR